MASVFQRLHSIYFNTHGYIEWSSEDLQNIEELNAIEPGITDMMKTYVRDKVPGFCPTLALGELEDSHFEVTCYYVSEAGKGLRNYRWTPDQLTAFLDLMDQKDIEPC